ncbi:membrane protein [Arthrobacter phage ScienceWizSam]|uniref:Membrane protein n=1 Tax=Arthrobacter phage ScienceWizSam TaxID=2927283 RepID=A0A9E7P696_9CAUD|nr:membrane protein [Arthrobacter phage ScienceWizSam]UUG69291.1 membrane protein [Arthrobacter phage ScienceWizSam]
MSKNTKYVAFALFLPVLTAVVWVIWVLLLPSIRDHFLRSVSKKVERKILKNKKRKTKGLRRAINKKAGK